MKRCWKPIVAVSLLVLAVACESKDEKRPPEVARNTDYVAYATEYPEQVERVTKELDEAKEEATKICGEYATYGGQIKDPADPDKLVEVVDAADASGKSGDYVDKARQNREFARMLGENEGEIEKSLIGNVHGAAQQDNCPNPGNVSGAAKSGLKRGVDKRAEARLREANEGHRVLKRNAEKVGKQNVPALETQADQIARASYLANVELPQLKYELERLIEENERVRKTLEAEIEEEKKLQAEAGTSDADKKASEARVKELEEAHTKIAGQQAELEERRGQLEQLQKDIKQVQDDCTKALKTYKDELKTHKAGDKPAAAEPEPAQPEPPTEAPKP